MFMFMLMLMLMLMFVFMFVFVFMLMLMLMLMFMLMFMFMLSHVIPYAKHPLEIYPPLQIFSLLRISCLTLIILSPIRP